VSWLALGHTEPHILWVQGAVSLEVKWLSMKLTTYCQPISRLRISGAVPIKVKVKFSLEQTTKAQRGSRGVALLFL
jgi:hypothetical protein